MTSAEFHNFKVQENAYPHLDNDKKIEYMGRLKALEELSTYVDIIRESLTRELVVNGVKSFDDLCLSTKTDNSTESTLPDDLKRDINELLKDDSSSDKSANSESETITI